MSRDSKRTFDDGAVGVRLLRPVPDSSTVDDERWGSDDSRYEDAFDRVFSRVRQLDGLLARERRETPERIHSLLAQPVARRWLLIHNSRCFRTLTVAEALLDAAWEIRFDDPKETLCRCELALAVAERLPADAYGWRLLEDLRARICVYLGNARRVQGDPAGAQSAFEASREHLQRGTGSAIGEAEWLHYKSFLLRDGGDLESAVEFLDRSLELYRSEGCRHEMGLVMLARGHAAELQGNPQRHRAMLQDALECIDAQREPKAVLAAAHNLILSFQEEGRSAEALSLLVRWRHLYWEIPGRTSLLRLHWLEGNIARDLGRLDAAEGALRQARRGFEELTLPFETAFVSLDLAALYLMQRRHQDAAELAATTAALFQGHGSHRGAAAALILFSRAAHRQEASRSLVDKVGRFLEEAQEDPEARFRPADRT